MDDGLSGRRDFDEAMADYERRRNEATTPDYHMNLERARFTPMSQTEADVARRTSR